MKNIDLSEYIDTIQDFPTKGIIFKDISPLLANGKALSYTIKMMSKYARNADVIVGPDARGFLFGTPVAAKLKKPFVMVRKAKKLPGEVIKQSFDFEYGASALEMQKGRIKPGQNVVVIDDVLATGGTTKAIIDLVESQGAKVSKVIFLLELTSLEGSKKYKDIDVVSLIKI